MMEAQKVMKVLSAFVALMALDAAVKVGDTALILAALLLFLLALLVSLAGRRVVPLIVNHVLARITGLRFHVGSLVVTDRYAVLDMGSRVALLSVLQLRVLLPVEAGNEKSLAVVTTSYAEAARQLPEGSKFTIAKLPTDVADIIATLYKKLAVVNFAIDYKSSPRRGGIGHAVWEFLHPEAGGSVEQLRERSRQLQRMIQMSMQHPPVENITYVLVASVFEKVRGLDPRVEHLRRLDAARHKLLSQPDIEVVELRGFRLAEVLYGELLGHDRWAKGRGEVSSYGSTAAVALAPVLVASMWLYTLPASPLTTAALAAVSLAATAVAALFDMPLLPKFMSREPVRVRVAKYGDDRVVHVRHGRDEALHLFLSVSPRKPVADMTPAELGRVIRGVSGLLYGMEGNVSLVSVTARPAVREAIRRLEEELARLEGRVDRESVNRREEVKRDLDRLREVERRGKMVYSFVVLTEPVGHGGVHAAMTRLEEKKGVVGDILKSSMFDVRAPHLEELAVALTNSVFVRAGVALAERIGAS